MNPMQTTDPQNKGAIAGPDKENVILKIWARKCERRTENLKEREDLS